MPPVDTWREITTPFRSVNSTIVPVAGCVLPVSLIQTKPVILLTVAIEVVEVAMPAGQEVSYPADAFFRHHVLWVRSGRLDVSEGGQSHVLHAGDSLVLGPPSPCTYANRTARPTTYAVILGSRR